MEIKALKTTGERVFVLTERQEDGLCTVRRAQMTENGIFHAEDSFYKQELESIEDNIRREANEMLLKARIQKELLDALKKEEGEADNSLAARLQVN